MGLRVAPLLFSLLLLSPALSLADYITTNASVTGKGSCSQIGTTSAGCELNYDGSPYAGGGSAFGQGSLTDGHIGAKADYLMGNGLSGGVNWSCNPRVRL
jgi:hypothetical protein